MNRFSFKQLTGVVAFIGLGFSAVDAGAVQGTVTGQIIDAKTGAMVCGLVLINGEYKTYSCTGNDNRGAPFTLPYDYATNSQNESANKLHVFAAEYEPIKQLITQPNQSVRIELTRIADLESTSAGVNIVSSPLTGESGCLDVAGGKTTDGTDVIVSPCNNGISQRWKFTSFGLESMLGNKESRICLHTRNNRHYQKLKDPNKELQSTY